MNTSQLECFLAVAKYLNFSKASESVQLTQPAVSRQINALEDELSVRLFIRTSRKVELTIAGIQFIEDAREMLKISNNAKSRFQTDKGRDTSVLFGVGCHNHFEQLALVPILSRFLSQYPRIHPTVRMAPPPIIEPQLEEQKLDLILGFRHHQRYDRVAAYHELTTCPIACICRNNHPLAGRNSLTSSELSGNHILYDINLGVHPLLQQEHRIASNTSASNLYYTDGADSAITLVKAGVGFTLHPDLPCCRTAGLCFIPLTDLPPLSFGVYTNPQNKKKFVREFIQIGKDVLSG